MPVCAGDKLKIPASDWNRAIDMVKHVGVSAPSNLISSRSNGIVIDPDLFIPEITSDLTSVDILMKNYFDIYCVNVCNGLSVRAEDDVTSLDVRISQGEMIVISIGLFWKSDTSVFRALWITNGIILAIDPTDLEDNYHCLGVVPILCVSAGKEPIDDKLPWTYMRFVDRPVEILLWRTISDNDQNLSEISADATPYFLG